MRERLAFFRSGGAVPPTSRPRASTPRAIAAVAAAILAALWLAPTSASAQQRDGAQQTRQTPQAQEQVLTWTADDSVTEYASAPAEATAGPATIVFENSTDTGNTMGMSHTLTFETSDPNYNDDVDVDILANPYDDNDGRYEVQVDLSPGTYYYFCKINGHTMSGELVVTEDGETDTTPPEVSAEVTGEQDADGAYVDAATVELTATDGDSGVDTVEYSLDGEPYATYTDPVEVNQPGEHTLTYRATDRAGNTSEPASVTFTVTEPEPGDTSPPDTSASVSGDQDADGDYVGSATVTLSASDSQSGVESVEYSLNDQPFTTYSEPLTVTDTGEHTVAYRATDNAGNTSEPDTATFTVTDVSDACPGSDIRDTVIIDGRDTGVDNAATGNGCTINELIAPEASYKNHGAFVNHVDEVTDKLVADSIISGKEKGRVMRAAGRSDVGKN